MMNEQDDYETHPDMNPAHSERTKGRIHSRRLKNRYAMKLASNIPCRGSRLGDRIGAGHSGNPKEADLTR